MMDKDFEECLEHLCDVVNQACSVDCDSDMGTHLDSMSLSAYEDAIRYLVKHGKAEIVIEAGRRVIAHLL